MERSLRRARSSERALLEERDLLEIKVEERTREVREMQKDKVAQLYRFAEFGKLSSGVFHDLMNSLNTVVAHVDRLEHTPDHLPEAQAYIAKAVQTGRRIGTYVSAVRKQIADNELRGAFSLAKEVSDAQDMLQYKAREAGVLFDVDMPHDIVINGNAVKFYQIVLNLMSNAIDAYEGMHGEHRIYLRATATGEAINITIKDWGCGIDPEIVTEIFNPFFTTKPYGKGIGLGLSHTKEMIEKDFFGTIAVQSTKGAGTTFIITIPYIRYDSSETM